MKPLHCREHIISAFGGESIVYKMKPHHCHEQRISACHACMELIFIRSRQQQRNVWLSRPWDPLEKRIDTVWANLGLFQSLANMLTDSTNRHTTRKRSFTEQENQVRMCSSIVMKGTLICSNYLFFSTGITKLDQERGRNCSR